MSTVYALLAVAAVVMIVAGAFKLRDPASSEPVLRLLHLPATPWAARLYGVAEIGVGAGALLLGGVLFPLAAAVLFGGFALVVVRLLRLGDAAPSCGCFGRLSSAPSRLHVMVNLAAASVAVVAAVHNGPGLAALTTDGAGIPMIELVVAAALVALASWLVIAVVTVLPPTLEATRRGPRPPAVRTFDIPEGNW